MTPQDLRDMLSRLGLSQAGAAKALGITTRAVEHWIAGTRPIPRMAELALRYLELTHEKTRRPKRNAG